VLHGEGSGDKGSMTHYDVLNTHRAASASELKSAYRRMALLLHPDKNASPQVPGLYKIVFTSRMLCKNQPSFHSPSPSALPTLLQYYCTAIAQYTTPPPTTLLYAIHHTQLVLAISCKGQIPTLHIEYAERRRKYGILFTCRLFCEYINLEYVRVNLGAQVRLQTHALLLHPDKNASPQVYIYIYRYR